MIARAAPATAHPGEDATELLADETVDEEVDGRVERQKGVGDRVDAVADDVVVELDRLEAFEKDNGEPEADVRKLADDEHAYH